MNKNLTYLFYCVTAEVLRDKWKNLKRCYTREKRRRKEIITKSGAGGLVNRRGFCHFGEMSFLDKNSRSKK